MEAVGVSQYDLPAVHLGDHLDRGVAVAAHPEVLVHADGRGGWHGEEAERDGEPLAVVSQPHLPPLRRLVLQRPLGVRHVPPSPDPRRHLLRLPVDLRRPLVIPVPGVEHVRHAGDHHPAAPGLLADAPRPHQRAHPRHVAPPPRPRVEVGQHDVRHGVRRIQPPHHPGRALGERRVPVSPARGEEGLPDRGVQLGRRAPVEQVDGLAEAAGAAEQVDHAGVVVRPRGDAVLGLHGLEVGAAGVEQPGVAAGEEQADEGDVVRPAAGAGHVGVDGEGLPAPAVLRVPDDQRRPRDGAPGAHRVEHRARVAERAGLGVHGHERVAD
ncbi:Os01g0884850, partial [Oryza sativa Japonica Group]